jgi:hypothetical protein
MGLGWKAAALALLFTSVGAACATSSTTEDEQSARHYVVDHIRSRNELVTSGPPWYRTLDEVLPNVRYREGNGKTVALTDLVVAGKITEVTKGAGFLWNEDAARSTTVSFDDRGAVWKTVHLRVTVDQAWGRSSPEDTITVGLATAPNVDFPKLRAGLTSLGKVALFLHPRSVSAPVFGYDPSLYGILEDGAFVATIASDGRLALPFLEAGRAQQLLAGVDTVQELERHAQAPERDIPLKRDGGIVVRDG